MERFAHEFQIKRIRAEKRAYRASKLREAASIYDIYRNFVTPRGLVVDAELLVEAEIQLERESIYPIQTMVRLINRLREDGHRVIFVSDMYLPGPLLEPILHEIGVMRKSDKLYMSCDIGLTKHSGRLYHHILQCEQLLPDQLDHTGDNVWSDVKVPLSIGIRAHHFAPSQLTSHEMSMAGRRLPRLRSSSHLAALSRRARLAGLGHPDEERADFESLIHSTIAPFLVSYAMWVLEQATLQKLDRLYFVARDGEVLLHIAKILCEKRQAPELRYLHGSRRAWIAPSIHPDQRGWEKLLITPGQSNSRCDILSRAGLDQESIARIQEILRCDYSSQLKPLNRNAAEAFLTEVISNPEAAAIMFESAAKYRSTALLYLEQQGILDGSKWALVDAGWSLNCQAALKRILNASNSTLNPRGYYIALTRDHLSAEEAGPAYAFILPHGSIFSRRRVIIEHCFTPSTHATTRGYRMDGATAVPVFGKELRGHDELNFAYRVHEAASALARFVANDPKLEAEFRSYHKDIANHAENLLRYPRKKDAQYMATFSTIADLRHEKSFVQPLCRPLNFSDVWSMLRITFARRRNIHTSALMWLEGSSVLSAPHIRIPIAVMLVADALRNRFRARS
jgi:FMN phosphatase YigB (HAD superfamily)